MAQDLLQTQLALTGHQLTLLYSEDSLSLCNSLEWDTDCFTAGTPSMPELTEYVGVNNDTFYTTAIFNLSNQDYTE
jgi:hypothetical protein